MLRHSNAQLLIDACRLRVDVQLAGVSCAKFCVPGCLKRMSRRPHLGQTSYHSYMPPATFVTKPRSVRLQFTGTLSNLEHLGCCWSPHFVFAHWRGKPSHQHAVTCNTQGRSIDILSHHKWATNYMGSRCRVIWGCSHCYRRSISRQSSVHLQPRDPASTVAWLEKPRERTLKSEELLKENGPGSPRKHTTGKAVGR